MANPLPPVRFLLRRGFWRRTAPPRAVSPLVGQAFSRNGQQQKLYYYQTAAPPVYRIAPRTLPDSPTRLIHYDVQCLSGDAEFLLHAPAKGTVQRISTKATVARTGQKQTAGKPKKHGGAAPRDPPTDSERKRDSRPAKSRSPPSTKMSSADVLGRGEPAASSAVEASGAGTLKEGFLEERSATRQRVVHGTLRSTEAGGNGKSDDHGTHPESGAKCVAEEAAIEREEEEAIRISHEDYWKLKERTQADHSTHPPYMYPMDPEMQPKGPPLEPHTRQKSRLKYREEKP